MKIGVLLNHYEPHQVPHVVPFAFALSALRSDWEVHILCSTEEEAAFTADIAELYPNHNCQIKQLSVPLSARIIDPLVQKVAFYRKVAVQKANVKLFATFDALLVPEMTSLSLRNNPLTAHVKLIFTGHGAGDGYNQKIGMYDPRIELFDLVLFPGRRLVDELVALGRLKKTPYGVVGYPKLELSKQKTGQKLFNNDRPTVLYNPTQNRKATSWHHFGTDVLDYFQASDEFNLIFAPHVLLFKRPWSRGSGLPRRYCSTDTMLVDTGSRASVDMSYIHAADIYLGDLSSQVYEFIANPRPCVFLDPFGRDYQNNSAFRSWSFGPVVRDIKDLGSALRDASFEFEKYEPAQKTSRDLNFAQSTQAASVRGAQVIAEFLDKGKVSKQWL